MTTATRALPEHGTLTRRKSHNCTCPACRACERNYMARRARLMAYGRWQPFVDAEPVRAHVRMLMTYGIGWQRTARLAGVSNGGLSRLLYGTYGTGYPPSKRVRTTTADRILAIKPIFETSAPDHVAHGYTMRDIHRAARCACAADRTLVSDITTRYDIAWSAIAEHLIGSPQPPTWDNLVRVGWQAIYRDVKAVRRLYGVDSSGRSGDVASAPRFVAYWTHIATDSIGEGITERIAVHQVLGALPESQREAVVALATLDDYQKGADALGINYKAMVARLGEARRRFRRHWYAPETAPPIKGTDRRIGSHSRGVPTHCPQGHEYTPENTIFRPSRPRSRICRTCSTARDAAKYAKRKAAA